MLRQLNLTLALSGALAVIAYVIYSRLKGDITGALPTPEKFTESVKSIVSGGPRAVASIWSGPSETEYISTAQQKALAEAALARKRALAGVK